MLLLSAQHAHVSRFQKSRRVERQQTENALARQERQIGLAFRDFVADARSHTTLKEVANHLSRTDISAAMAVLEDKIRAFGQIVPKAFTEAALITFTGLARRLEVVKVEKARGKVNLNFDPSEPRAATLMQNARLNFVQGFTSAQREATRDALANAFRLGASTRDAVKAFRDSIGLTKTQQDAVNSYEDLLRAGSKAALDRELRDRRFDPSVERAATEGDLLDEDQIDRMVDRYRDNMINYRAENIARTESLAVVSQARLEATQQIVDQADIDPDTVRRTWRATKDKRTRDSHWEMDGQTVGLDEPYVAPSGEEIMYPGDPNASAEERINCRCTETIGIG